MLGFVRRTCRKNFNLDIAKMLYRSLVRSHLEFASVVRSPYQEKYVNQVESVQKQTIIYLNGDFINRAENGYVLSPYLDRCRELELTTLVRRRINASVLFMHKTISGRYVSPEIRNRLDLNSGIRTLRNPEFIKLKMY